MSEREALAQFDALLDLDPAAREQRLAQLQREQPAVGALVTAWLGSESHPDPRLQPAHYVPLLPPLPHEEEPRAPAAGDRIGPYRLMHEIGRGGMGSVWLAERAEGDFAQQAALKLIRPDLGSSEAEPRFRRERQILAGLKHPNIAQLLDGGVTADGRLWLAMEYIGGHSLRETLARGALPVKRVIALAAQIASALAHAHAAGVVHRDLKPDNVMLSRDGYAKILDFGVAKLLADDGDGGHGTVTATQPGRMIGTTPYMSPEQASGEHVDFRSDQFALGALLYEIATGRAAFARATPSQTVAAVLRDAPPALDSLADSLPPGLLRIMRRCLEKDPADRYGATSDLAHDLAELQRGALPEAGRAATPLRRYGVGLAAALALGVAGWWLGRASNGAATSASAPVAALSTEVSIAPAERLWFGAFALHAFSLSPDGRRVVFAGYQDGKRRLFLRDLGTHQAVALPGTDGGVNAVFSPDGEWIAFLAYQKLKKVSVGGGGAVLLAEAPNALGGLTWGEGDRVLYSPSPSVGIWEVGASGGEPRKLTEPDTAAGEASHVWPCLVPGTRLLIYAAEMEAADSFDAARIYAVDLDSGKRTLLVDGGSDPRVVDGRLYYARAGTVYEAPLDLERVALRASPKPIQEGVAYAPATGAAQFAVAPGTRLFLRGAQGWDLFEPVIVARDGSAQSLGLAPAYYDRARLSPDGRRVVFQITAADDDLWSYDLERRVLARITNQDENIAPAWTPDGQYIVYSHHGTPVPPPPTLYRRRADGSGEAQQLLPPEPGIRARLHIDVAPNGHTIAYGQYTADKNFDLWLYDSDTGANREWLSTPAAEVLPRFSPDGRWIAYTSSSGENDNVFIQSLAGEPRRWQVSTNGGHGATWRRDGRELYFNLQGAIYAVSLQAGDDLAPGAPTKLFQGDYSSRYDTFADGDHFLMLKRVPEPARAGPLLIDIGTRAATDEPPAAP